MKWTVSSASGKLRDMNKKNLPRAIRPEAAQDAPVQPAGPGETRKPEPVRAQTAPSDPAAKDRRARATQVVKRLSLWSGAAGLIPLPLIDLAAVGGVQVEMLRRISKIYGVPFSQNSGKAVIAGVVGSMIPASSGVGAASLIKGMPVLGTAIGMLTTPTLSVGATYAIGMAFIQHFETGGTLLDFNPPDYREFLKPQPRRSGAQAV
jgi:uncharacterized protein (DUF697 family)